MKTIHKLCKMIKLSSLKPLEKNPFKSKGDSQIQAIAKSIQDFEKMMSVRQIVYDEEMAILGGNKRYFALKMLGYKEINEEWTKQVIGWTEEEKREFIVKDNTHFGSEWDFGIFDEWGLSADQLTEWGVDLLVWDETKKNVEEDDFEESENIETDIQCGDLFKIGNHFLFCGDATKAVDYEKLLKGIKSDMIFTDPPYDLQDSYSQNIFDVAKEDSHIFIMNSDNLLVQNVNNGFNWFRKFFAVDFRQARLVSNNQPMTRIDLIAEFCKGKTKFNNLHDGFSTLIECAKIHNDNETINFGHKQAKKIELPANFIQHYTNEKEIVCDFFGGSGSTMAACEQLNRICYMMELEPKNCQIIINRMDKIYNLKFEKI